MNGVIKEFYMFLKIELGYLETVNKFFESIPKLITENKVDSFEFGNFLEKYEIEIYKIASNKKSLLMRIAEYYNIDVTEVNLTYISNAGHKEFVEIGKKIFSLSNKIKYTLLKASIYLTKFSQLNNELKKVNRFLFQDNYAANGIENKDQKNSIFFSEA